MRFARLVRVLAGLAFVIMAATASAQSQPPRAPVILARRATVTPFPTPTPPRAVDPTGIYRGNVSGEITGFDNGTFNLGFWEFIVRSKPCLDCDPGQYTFSLDYRSVTYQRPTGIIQETGFGAGVLNPSRGVISFSMIATNCSVVNPNGTRFPGGTGLYGYYLGGHDGEAPGHRLEFTTNQLGGHISGRDCFNQIISSDPLLPKQ